MAKPGDTVRYLNAVGGGKITRIEGQIAYVDEDGFETPVLLKELVVVMPAGHERKESPAKLMFDQKAVDAVKARDKAERDKSAMTKDITAAAAPQPVCVEETRHGEKINLLLAFEPADIKTLSSTSFAAVLVNDSNYFLSFAFLTRAASARGWSVAFSGTVEPNMVIDLASYSHADLPGIEQVAVQAIAWKKDKEFEYKEPVSVRRRLDLKKFYKLHCFRPGVYFETPVLEVPLVRDDIPVSVTAPDPAAIRDAMAGAGQAVRTPEKHTRKSADNPHKLLPLIEVDLHIGELLDSTAGMDNAAIKEVQLDAVRKTLTQHSRRLGQKIVFIHGKGDGVLREAVRTLLRREYPACEWQDASFREYGFGATLVTIHSKQ
ncbi:MAG: DUF2027 domain-containing protein [Muribaculaceae bacterium]|nr:DUF2027 domain-containing protein [Muribaculaceae bacterium]